MVLGIKTWAFENSKLLVRAFLALWLLNAVLYLVASVNYPGLTAIQLALIIFAGWTWTMNDPRT